MAGISGVTGTADVVVGEVRGRGAFAIEEERRCQIQVAQRRGIAKTRHVEAGTTERYRQGRGLCMGMVRAVAGLA